MPGTPGGIRVASGMQRQSGPIQSRCIGCSSNRGQLIQSANKTISDSKIVKENCPLATRFRVSLPKGIGLQWVTDAEVGNGTVSDADWLLPSATPHAGWTK